MTNLPPHRHCIVCGKVTDREESFCDEICSSKYKSAQKRQQVMFAFFMVLLLLVLVLPAVLGPKG